MSTTLQERLWLLAWFYHSLYRFRTKWKHFLRRRFAITYVRILLVYGISRQSVTKQQFDTLLVLLQKP